VLLLAGLAPIGCRSFQEREPHALNLTTQPPAPKDSEFSFPHVHVVVTNVAATDPPGQDTRGFFGNGQLAYLVETDADGALHGRCRAWFANGQQLLEARYVHGWPDGLVTEWDEHGNVVNQQRWFQGVPVN
jgi:hypothetical protein